MSAYNVSVVVKSCERGGYEAKAYRPGKSGEEWVVWSWGETPYAAADRCKASFEDEDVRFQVEGLPPSRRPQHNGPRRPQHHNGPIRKVMS